MPNIPEIIESVHEVFVASLDAEELNMAYAKLKRMLETDSPNEHNRENARALLMRLGAKQLAVVYFQSFAPEAGEDLSAYLRGALPDAERLGYTNTAAALQRFAAALAVVRPVMDEAYARLTPLRGEEGLIASLSECRDAIAFLEGALETLDGMDGSNPFGERAHFFDMRARAVEAVTTEINDLKERVRSLSHADAEKVFRTYADVRAQEVYEYYPAFSEPIDAGLVVLRTPFFEEAELYVSAEAKARGNAYAVIRTEELDAEAAEALFGYLRENKTEGILLGFERREGLFRTAIAAAKAGARLYAVDSSPEGELYSKLVGAAKEGFSVLDVGCRYLSMPYFREVSALLEEKGMISGADEYALLRTCPFMGYVGLNAASRAFSAGRDWKREAKELSDRNFARAKGYLSQTPVSQLVDAEWGVKDEAVYLPKGRDFDYDDIRGINSANIKKILACGGNVFARCGLIARYCTLCGQDKSVWQSLSMETKSERLTAATKLILRLLDADLDPVVELVPESEWKRDDAGGYCAEGGKLIRYRDKSMQDYDWAVQTVCHECFHAFQHRAERGFEPWFFAELGVTRGRIEEWKFNFLNYEGRTNTLTYKVEIVEGDARAFQHDCFNMSEELWHKIDFE